MVFKEVPTGFELDRPGQEQTHSSVTESQLQCLGKKQDLLVHLNEHFEGSQSSG